MTQKYAVNIMIGLLILIILFHISVVIQMVPYSIVWAGKLKTLEDMYIFESVSIGINVLLIIILSLKINYIKNSISPKIMNGILWVFFVIFALNTIGNLFASSLVERIGGTLGTLLFSILLLISIRGKK
ncbi:hypothetical protein K2X92_00230 [Candidatus Gracilibacteria bacterium]|nr:hypothetical protein [Candidatus Gracilibacteria bacterium]